jgi:flagellar motor protein MotB
MDSRRRLAVPGRRLSARPQRTGGARPIRPAVAESAGRQSGGVYGYTDNQPVGPALQRADIANNIDLSSRRADNVVAYFLSQGVNRRIISAKGFGDTHPVASNDTPQGRAQNRRIEIVLEGPGA